MWMLGKSRGVGKWNHVNSWQVACNQSNEAFTRKAEPRRINTDHARPGRLQVLDSAAKL